jgi:hypothetical protein
VKLALAPALHRLYVASGLRSLLPLRAKTALRRAWVWLARASNYPVSSPRAPRPPLLRNRLPMRLTTVLLACDLNRDYIGFWPLAQRAWREIVGIEPVLVLVAADEEVPDELRDDEAVIRFEPIRDIHTAFQAQCIRLLYPALLEADGAVLIADVDLLPLKRSYFVEPLAKLDARFFVTYRDTRLERGEINIMFNAATPATWTEIFGVRTVDEARAQLASWADGREYDGRRGWEGWYTDQQILFEALRSWPAARDRHWLLDDVYCGFNRLDRLELERENGLEPHRVRALQTARYSDYNCLTPYDRYRNVHEQVLELALEAARR